MVCFGKSFLKNEIFFAPKLHSLILFCIFAIEKSCWSSEHVHIAEVVTIAKSLPLLR